MNFYEALGVPRGASSDEVKRAYRKRRAKAHPDKGGDTATFALVQKAFETLSDDEARKHYDRTGAAPDSPPDMRSMALQQLAAMVLQVVEQAPNVDSLDILASVKRSIADGMTRGRQQESATQAQIAKLNRAAKRIKTKGDNIIKTFLETKARELEAALEGTRRHIELGEMMREICEEYTCTTDKGSSNSTTSTFNFFTG